MGEAGAAPLRSVERTVRGRALWAAIGCGLIIASSTGTALGQDEDRGAIAEALFRAGRELMASGDYAQACPKFAESQRLDPKPGTAMNLALCHEKSGRTASAWSEYLQAAELSRRAGQAERESVARARARALEPALAHIVLEASPTPNVTVTLDGQAIGTGAFGTPIPIDFGDHVIVATASGKKSATVPFVVSTAAEQQSVRVPSLDDDQVAPPPPKATIVPELPTSPRSSVDERATGRTWGFVAGGAGVALLGVGTYFGINAFAEKNSAENECGKVYCTSQGLDAIHSMKTAEAVSTITIATGIAAVGAGVFLVVLNPPRRSSRRGVAWSLTADPSLRGVRLGATW